MKKIGFRLFLAIIFILVTNRMDGQELEGKDWLSLNLYTYADSAFYKFENDTFYFKQIVDQVETSLPVSIYLIEEDTLTLNDLLNCDQEGKYVYEIQQDTLSFELIEDNCVSRGDILSVIKLILLNEPNLLSNDSCFEILERKNPTKYILKGNFTNCNIFVLDENENVVQFLLNVADKIEIDLNDFADSLHFIRIEHQDHENLFFQEILKP